MGFNRQALPYLTKALGEYYALENIGATALPEAQAKAAERAQRQYDLLKARGEIKDWREYLLSTGDTEDTVRIKALERVRCTLERAPRSAMDVPRPTHSQPREAALWAAVNSWGAADSVVSTERVQCSIVVCQIISIIILDTGISNPMSEPA